MSEKLNLLDCIAHGTAPDEFMATFHGDVRAAVDHLVNFYRENGGDATDDEIDSAATSATRALRNWGGPNRNQGRKITKLRIGRGFTLAVGQQVLCRETFPDGVTPGKVGVIAIENGKDGDYTIKVNFDDGSAFVIGVYKEN